MAEKYNVQAIMNSLKKKSEMDPDQHDGCYELMKETIEAYSKLRDFSAIDYKDLKVRASSLFSGLRLMQVLGPSYGCAAIFSR